MTTLAEYLQRKNLLPSTQQKYQEILDSTTGDPRELVRMVKNAVAKDAPLGTVLPLRAAVRHYLTGVLHYRAEEVDELLPAAQGKEALVTQPLSQEQLAIYHMAVDEIRVEPAHTILILLPATGLKISEICTLRTSDVENDGLSLNVKSLHAKNRSVPLTQMAANALINYINENKPTDWLFPGVAGPIGPHAIRRYTRQIGEEYPDLLGLCPQVLRSTYARMQLKGGAGLEQLQRLMGHKSYQTTSRYLT